MKRRPLRFGILGVGRIGKIHIENLVNRIPGAEVVAISDVAVAEMEAVAAKFNIERMFGDHRELLDSPEVDAVVICSPTNLHYSMIIDAAARGKHIFCEKPIDLSIEKVQAANAAVSRSGVQMMVGFNRRFDPNFLKVRESITVGVLGQPHILRITSRDPGPPPETYIRASGGIFLDMTIHDFDMARYPRVLCDRGGIHTALPLNFFLERYAESYLLEMRAFVDAVENRTPVPVGGEDGLNAMVIALAAGKSARENRPVKLTEIYEG